MKPTITTTYNDSQRKIARHMLQDVLAQVGEFSSDGYLTKKILFFNTQQEVQDILYTNYLRLKEIHKDEKNLSEILTISKDFGMLTYKGVKAILVFQPLNK